MEVRVGRLQPREHTYYSPEDLMDELDREQEALDTIRQYYQARPEEAGEMKEIDTEEIWLRMLYIWSLRDELIRSLRIPPGTTIH